MPITKFRSPGLYMVIAMFCFVINDTCVKIAGASLTVGQIVLIRGAFTVVLIAGLCVRWGVLPALPQVASRPVILRAPLRASEGKERSASAIDEAITRKPKGHDFIFDRRHNKPAVARHMSVTGGV